MRFVLRAVAVVIPLYLLAQFWFVPWLEAYAPRANCDFFGELSGVHLLFYGAFVALPASLALLVLAFEGPRSLRVLRTGQDPLPGEKVLRKTPYRYGWRARVRPLLLLACVGFILSASAWGYFQARAFIASVPPCETNANHRD